MRRRAQMEPPVGSSTTCTEWRGGEKEKEEEEEKEKEKNEEPQQWIVSDRSRRLNEPSILIFLLIFFSLSYSSFTF